MELKQIALSPDGMFIYALDANGRLWFAQTRLPSATGGGGLAINPTWTPIAPPPKQPGQV
jgi:hypothetical protein